MAKKNPKHTVPTKPKLNKPCCVCGNMIRSGSYHVVGTPGCRARGVVWPDGLYTHTNCRPGTLRWYRSLDGPVPGFKKLYNKKSNAVWKRLYSTARFLKEEEEEDDTVVPSGDDCPATGTLSSLSDHL